MIEYKIKFSDEKIKSMVEKILYEENQHDSLLYLLLNDEDIDSENFVLSSE